MKRWYVNMLWHHQPEGGSYGTVVWAQDAEGAEKLCRREMAEAKFDKRKWRGMLPDQVMWEWGGAWRLVDCFDLDDFIRRHTAPFLSPDELHVTLGALRMYQKVPGADGGLIDALCERLNS